MSIFNHYCDVFAAPLNQDDESHLEVVSVATSEPVTLELARRQCRVDVDPTLVPPSSPEDELIGIYLSAAREWAELVLGMVISPTTVNMSLDAFPSGDITLESWPILSLPSVTYTDTSTLTPVNVDPLSYYLDTKNFPARLRLNTDYIWPDAVKNSISLRYELGYSMPGDSPQSLPLPARIKLAILMVMTHFYEHRSEQTDQVLQTLPLGASSLLAGLSVRRGFA